MVRNREVTPKLSFLNRAYREASKSSDKRLVWKKDLHVEKI